MSVFFRPFLSRFLAACPALAVMAAPAAAFQAQGNWSALLVPVFLCAAGLWLLPVSLGVFKNIRSGARDQYTLFPDFARRLSWHDWDTRRRLLDNALSLALPANIALALMGLAVFHGPALAAWPGCLNALAATLLVMAVWLLQPHGAKLWLSLLPFAGMAGVMLAVYDGRAPALALSWPQALWTGAVAVWLLARLAADAVRASPRVVQSGWLCMAGFAGACLLAFPSMVPVAAQLAWGLWLAGFSALWCRDAQARAQARIWLLSLR